jgi:predicted DNA-binding transcriptional regulator YafY
VNPLGLVVRGNLLYLVCTLWDYQDLRQLALHRVLTASPTDKPVTRPDGFNLDEYIQSGEFQYPVGPPIQLKAKFSRAAAAHLVETPLSDDQVIESLDADHVCVTATVRDTAQLDWWLLGFGSGVLVLAPPALTVRIAEATQTGAAVQLEKSVEQ